jgi:hypothetical protein
MQMGHRVFKGYSVIGAMPAFALARSTAFIASHGVHFFRFRLGRACGW